MFLSSCSCATFLMFLCYFPHVLVFLSSCSCASLLMFLCYFPHVLVFLFSCSCASLLMFLCYFPHVLVFLFSCSCASLLMFLCFSPHVPVLLSTCSFLGTVIHISVFDKLNLSFIKPTYAHSMYIIIKSIFYSYMFRRNSSIYREFVHQHSTFNQA